MAKIHRIRPSDPAKRVVFTLDGEGSPPDGPPSRHPDWAKRVWRGRRRTERQLKYLRELDEAALKGWPPGKR